MAFEIMVLLGLAGVLYYAYKKGDNEGYKGVDTSDIDSSDVPKVMIFKTVLMVGDRGQEVEKLQEVLDFLGYSPGAIDGIYGHLTERAVRQVQEKYSLAIDGMAGAQTFAALNTELEKYGGYLKTRGF